MQAINITKLKDSFKVLHEKYHAYLPAVFFASGFILDILTLGEVDDLSNMIILSLYLTLAIIILALEFLEIKTIETDKKWLKKAFEYRNDGFHFFLGALLSAFTLFYFKSSSISNSFFFMLIMMALLLLNETSLFQKKGIIIRSILIMLAVVSYLILMVPTLTGEANALIFALCIVMALAFSGIAFWALSKNLTDKSIPLKNMFYPQVSVLIVFVLLYWLKVLPPVPLSIKNIGVYYKIDKTEGEYYAYTLHPTWKFWLSGDQNFKAREGDQIFVTANIFSPAGFKGKIYMRWLKSTQDGWTTSDRIPIEIWGGRAKGFRGFAFKNNYTEGDWQVRVETDDGLEIGRLSFEVSKDPAAESDRIFRRVKLN